ncbi:hypothetical protein BCR33DRAFT_779700 [Rhizoclosmatium globosum]|uniref:Uncharacterized protein n=1 Tax=Rhizoclosmatium globosum TaxID=329046 RepID=A0A1Y2CZT7_9FUNG|nr:hypothetical protein BCR33DRAFT_779700 [Rhizoclosmatium globosum]|eukprot:ORY52386.1 hypothetical protein BCR33DRAFT_779700 [Rhizoclosmatium globosum]
MARGTSPLHDPDCLCAVGISYQLLGLGFKSNENQARRVGHCSVYFAKAIQDFIAQELKKPWDQQQLLNQYWTLQLLLTKHYASSMGTKCCVNTATYAANLTALGQVHNWGRVHYLMDIMNRPDIGCDWFVYLDSDAYPWMKGHKVSLEEYFSGQQVAVES